MFKYDRACFGRYGKIEYFEIIPILSKVGFSYLALGGGGRAVNLAGEG